MNIIGCPVCGTQLLVRTAKGRKSNKVFLMMVCPVDGRHFRGFITDQNYLENVLERQSGHDQNPRAGGGGGK